MKNVKSNCNTLKMTQALLCLNAIVWLLFGIISLLRLSARYSEQSFVLVIIAIMMFGNVIAMLLTAWLLGKQKKLFYILALIVLFVNIILTFTDQFGLFDFITLLIDLIILGLLLTKRNSFYNHSDTSYLS